MASAAVPRQFGHRDVSLSWGCDRCPHRHGPGSSCPPTGVWLSSRRPVKGSDGVVWLKRPMPPDQWPTDGFRWWIRAHCGHPGGAKQFAFYDEKCADTYEEIFRADPCHWTGCPRADSCT